MGQQFTSALVHTMSTNTNGQYLQILLHFAGNWSPSDFPDGTSWQPYKKSHTSVNRDLEIVMEQADLVAYFAEVYNGDWVRGEEWKPKTNMELTYG